MKFPIIGQLAVASGGLNLRQAYGKGYGTVYSGPACLSSAHVQTSTYSYSVHAWFAADDDDLIKSLQRLVRSLSPSLFHFRTAGVKKGRNEYGRLRDRWD